MTVDAMPAFWEQVERLQMCHSTCMLTAAPPASLALQLWGKTLGIVGMGLVGKALATAAGALGMRVIHTTSNSSR